MSQALAGSFQEVVGVDVSPAMADLARSLLRSPLPCRFETSTDPDLRSYGSASFDLAFSVYVLQHLPRWLAERYLREFVRVTRPGGAIVFQIHGGLAARGLGWVSGGWLPAVFNHWSRWRNSRRDGARQWEVHWVRPPEVVRILRSAGARVVAVDRVPRPDGHLQGYWFFAVRDAGDSR